VLAAIARIGLVALSLHLVSCAQKTEPREDRFPVQYEFTVHNGHAGRVSVRYLDAKGSSVSLTLTEKHWVSDQMSFPRGGKILLVVSLADAGQRTLQCTATTRSVDDPDGTVYGGGGGSKCSIREIAGENPFSPD